MEITKETKLSDLLGQYERFTVSSHCANDSSLFLLTMASRASTSGHADLFTLLNTYAHPQDEKVEELSFKIENLLTKM